MAANREESKKLERRARSLLMTKQISASKMGLIRSLRANSGLNADDRNRTIIGLLQSCPDRAELQIKKNIKSPLTAKAKEARSKNGREQISFSSGDHSPTETSFYIDYLKRKYRSLKLFKVRYGVKRKNRFNLGFRKRLIPTRKFMKVLGAIYSMQDTVLSRLPTVAMDILNDRDIDDPVCFNYLRLMRSWLAERPLSAGYKSVKWMERANFEREFKEYLYTAFAIQKVSPEKKEEVLKIVESKLLLMPDLQKEKIFDADSDEDRRSKEKHNMDCDRQAMSYLALVKAFLFSENDEGSAVSAMLRSEFDINGYNKFLMMIIEVLIYQRPIALEDFIYKFEVRTAEVSSDEWNYSEEYLKKIGKDKTARRYKSQSPIREKLAFYDGIYALLRVHDGENELVPKCVGVQWNQIDKNKNNPEALFKDDFPVFLDGAVQFFNNTFLPLLDGSAILFKDELGRKITSKLFAKEIFSDELKTFRKILNDLHNFRTENPMLTVSRNEVVKIMRGQMVSMSHVERIIRGVGNFFYNTGSRLFPYYDRHRRWLSGENPEPASNLMRRPVAYTVPSEELTNAAPFPFYDCVIEAFDRPAPLSGALENKKLIGGIPGEGVIGYVLAYCYQTANMCLNAELSDDMAKREQIVKRLKEIS